MSFFLKFHASYSNKDLETKSSNDNNNEKSINPTCSEKINNNRIETVMKIVKQNIS